MASRFTIAVTRASAGSRRSGTALGDPAPWVALPAPATMALGAEPVGVGGIHVTVDGGGDGWFQL